MVGPCRLRYSDPEFVPSKVASPIDVLVPLNCAGCARAISLVANFKFMYVLPSFCVPVTLTQAFPLNMLFKGDFLPLAISEDILGLQVETGRTDCIHSKATIFDIVTTTVLWKNLMDFGKMCTEQGKLSLII